jgi:hypothetical protein
MFLPAAKEAAFRIDGKDAFEDAALRDNATLDENIKLSRLVLANAHTRRIEKVNHPLGL